MDIIPVSAAAQRLGISVPSVWKMIEAGRLSRRDVEGVARIPSDDVDRVAHERRAEAARRHPDPAKFATDIRRLLHPPTTGRTVAPGYGAYLLPTGRDAVRLLPPDAVAMFGRASLEAAAVGRERLAGCPWCWASMTARVHCGLGPQDNRAFRELFGCDPCPADRRRFSDEAKTARTELARLKARVDASTRTAAKDRARTEYDAAQRGASGAAARLRTATEALVRADPSSAATVASGAPEAQRRRSRLDCPCTTETVCADHARQLAARGRR